MSQNRVNPLRVLLVDDDEDDYLLFRDTLNNRVFADPAGEKRRFRIEWASNFQAAVEAFDRNEYDVYFIDHDLGPRTGIDLLPEAGARGVTAPLIILTGNEDASAELAAAQQGAADYLVKQFISALLIERSIRYALERKRTEQILKQAYARLEDLVQERTRELITVNRELENANLALRAEIEERIQAQAALNRIKEDLEVLVDERTAQLQETNQQLLKTNQQLEIVLRQLEAERARLSAIIANTPGALVVANKEGEVLMANPAAGQLFGPGLSDDDQPAGNAPLICYPDGRPYDPDDLPLTRSARFGETQINLELSILHPDGRMRYTLVNSAPILSRSGAITGAIALYQDITQRKAEEDQARENATRVEVQRRLIEYREKERLHIAQELHDGPIQDLLATIYGVNEVRMALQAGETGEMAQRLEELQASLQAQVQSLRSFTRELRPPAVLAFGLEKAMRSYCESFTGQYPDLFLHLDLMPDGEMLSEELRMALFRIFQELLKNVVRHANTNEAHVHFRIEGGLAILEVHDHGDGFDVPVDWLPILRAGHFGLVGVRERALAVGGLVDVESSPGAGTRIKAVVPIEPAREATAQRMQER